MGTTPLFGVGTTLFNGENGKTQLREEAPPPSPPPPSVSNTAELVLSVCIYYMLHERILVQYRIHM